MPNLPERLPVYDHLLNLMVSGRSVKIVFIKGVVIKCLMCGLLYLLMKNRMVLKFVERPQFYLESVILNRQTIPKQLASLYAVLKNKQRYEKGSNSILSTCESTMPLLGYSQGTVKYTDYCIGFKSFSNLSCIIPVKISKNVYRTANSLQ